MEILTYIKKRQLIATLLLFVAVVIFFTVKYISDNLLLQPHGTATIYSAPFNVTVKYHKTTKKISSSAKGVEVPLPVGEYDVTFSAKEFSDYTERVSIEDKGTYKIAFRLTPQTEEAKRQLEEKSLEYDPIYQSIYVLEREKYVSQNPSQDIATRNKFPYRGRGFSVSVCSAYRKDTIDKKGLGLCLSVDPISVGDKELTEYAINELKGLIGDDIEKYDIKINNSIFPRQEEIEKGLVYDCSRPDFAFCYLYKDSSSVLPHA